MFSRFLHDRDRRTFAPPDDGGGDDSGGQNTDDQGDGDKKTDADGKVIDKPDAKNVLDQIDTGDKKTGDDAGDDDGKGDGDDDKTIEPSSDGKLVFKDKPDWLNSRFFDEKTGEVQVQELAKSQADLREQISKGWDKTPKTAADYEFDLSDDEKAVETLALQEDDGAPDPVKSAFLEAMHKADIPQGKVNDIYKAMLNTIGELMHEAPSAQKVIDDIGRNGLAVLTNTKRHIGHLEEIGVLAADEAEAVRGWMQTGTDVRAYQAMRDRYGDKEIDIPPGSAPPSGASSKAELQAKLGKLVERANKGENVQAEHDTLMEDYKKTFGEEPAGTSLVG